MTLIIAHRGASRAAPENTTEAFRLAVEMGADGIELDVRRTLDDRLVVHHDPHLADGRVIRATKRAELPDSVPELSAALDACSGAFVNVEIKNDPAEPDYDTSGWLVNATAVELLRRREPMRWLVSSFDLDSVNLSRVSMPGVRTAWLTESASDDHIAATTANGHVAIHPYVKLLDEAAVRRAHAAGLVVNTWTCDDPERLRALMSWGVDGICTNVPDVALAIRRELAASGV